MEQLDIHKKKKSKKVNKSRLTPNTNTKVTSKMDPRYKTCRKNKYLYI